MNNAYSIDASPSTGEKVLTVPDGFARKGGQTPFTGKAVPGPRGRRRMDALFLRSHARESLPWEVSLGGP